MRIQHNIMAMNAYRNYTNNVASMKKNLEKLSSGYKINRAGDDAAGLAISEKMRAQITGLQTAQKNAKDGISLVQTAEGALTEVHDMLNRMYSLAEQSANGTYQDAVDREQMQKEIVQLKDEIDRISKSTNFNGIKLLDGSLGEASSTAVVKVADPAALNLADGVNINAPRDGEGKKASLDVTFDTAKTEANPDGTQFGAGDKVSFKLDRENGVTKTYTFNYDAGSAAAADPDNAASGKFTGATFAQQMTSLAAQINSTTDFNEYTATVKTDDDGNAIGITITAKSDASIPTKTLVGGVGTGVIVEDQSIKVETSAFTPGSNAGTAAVQATDKAIKNLIVANAADGSATEIQEGATVKFDFTVNGKTLSITLKASKDGAGENEFKIGNDTDATTTNIVNALTNAHFDQDTATAGVDETQLKFSDYFIATANNDGTNANKSGSIKIVADTAKAGNQNNLNAVTKAQVTSADGTAAGAINATGAAGTGATGDAAVAEATTYKFSNAFSKGDQVTLTGALSDGRNFEITLTADAVASAGDKKFDAANAASSIKAVLESADCKVKVTDANGNATEVAGNEIFGTGKHFTLTNTTDTLTITNAAAGAAGIKGATAKFSSLQVKKVGTMSATGATAVAGATPGKAENIVTFDPAKVESGTTIQIDGKEYEFVTDANRLSGDPSKTTAVVVDGLGDTATAKDIATALAKALDSNFDVDNNSGTYTASLAGSDANGKVFNISVTDNALVLKSVDKGAAAKAIDDIALTSEERNVTELKFTTTSDGADAPTYKPQVKVGDTVTINDKVYEFTNGGRTNGAENIAVDLSDIDATNVHDIVQKLADTVEANDDTILATVADELDSGNNISAASLKLTTKYKDGATVQYAAPKVETPRTSNSLDLQIGDDAEEYNRMKVTINAVNSSELGLADLDISTQDSARAAMQVIKDAINQVSDVRGTLGATQNRLDHTINNLSVMTENIQDAESTIRDTDVADEMMAYTKNNILIQSAQAMLAQANQVPQGVLQLLQ